MRILINGTKAIDEIKPLLTIAFSAECAKDEERLNAVPAVIFGGSWCTEIVTDQAVLLLAVRRYIL